MILDLRGPSATQMGGHSAVEPKLGTIEDFDTLVASAAELGLEIAIDYALQCSPDHPWLKEHPEWFFVRPDGTIKYAENPPKKYQDIYPLNFWCDDRDGLWNACRDILMFWIEHGVLTFRVDNPHTKPFAFWEWVISEVHAKHPDVVFLAEAFTRPRTMKLLAKLGFTQSYTYFTWKNTAQELRDWWAEMHKTSALEYMRGNLFANTPDILHEYLQRFGRPGFRVRLLLAATMSPLYGIYSGFELSENTPVRPGSEEYLDSEKYQIRVRSWDAPGNLDDDIKLLNAIRRDNVALQRMDNLEFRQSENEQVLFFTKTAPGWRNDLLIIVRISIPRARRKPSSPFRSPSSASIPTFRTSSKICLPEHATAGAARAITFGSIRTFSRGTSSGCNVDTPLRPPTSVTCLIDPPRRYLPRIRSGTRTRSSTRRTSRHFATATAMASVIFPD